MNIITSQGEMLVRDLKSALQVGDAQRARSALIRFIALPEALSMINTTWGGRRTLLALVLDPEALGGHAADLELIQHILEAGADVHALSDKRSALSFAVSSGNLAAVELLLARGAAPNESYADTTYSSGVALESLLVRALEAEHTAIALRLLEAGADPHGTPGWARPLQSAARHANALVAEALITRGVDVNAQHSDALKPSVSVYPNSYPSRTALMEAATVEANPVLPFLLQRGADINLKSDMYQRTALYDAVSSAAPVNTRRLLEAGANPNSDCGGNNTSLQALFTSSHGYGYQEQESKQRFLQCLDVLLEYGAEPNVGDGYLRPLAQAVRRRSIGSVLRLLNAEATTQGDQTELWLLAHETDDPESQAVAAELRHRQVAYHNGALKALLFQAALEGNAARVRVLAEQGADLNAVTTEGRREPSTPLIVAAERNHLEVVQELIAKGADLDVIVPLVGDTPLMRASLFWARTKALRGDCWDTKGVPKEEEALIDWLAQRNLAMVQALLNAGTNVNHANARRDTALHYAVQYATPAVVEALLFSDADIDARSNRNDASLTPLHMVLAYGRRFLLLQESPHLLNPPSTYGPPSTRKKSRLADAAEEDEAIVQLMISCGADVNARSKKGISPLYFASGRGTPSTVKMLLDAEAQANYQGAESRSSTPNSLRGVLEKGRCYRVMQRHGFELSDFEDMPADLLRAANDPQAAMPFPHSAHELQWAVKEDVEVLKLLIGAGVLGAGTGLPVVRLEMEAGRMNIVFAQHLLSN